MPTPKTMVQPNTTHSNKSAMQASHKDVKRCGWFPILSCHTLAYLAACYNLLHDLTDESCNKSNILSGPEVSESMIA